MTDFTTLLSKHLSSAFGTLQSRYSSTPQPAPLPLNQSPAFSTPHKFNPETLQWTPFPLPSSLAPQIDAEKTLCIFTWDIAPLSSSPGSGGVLSTAIETLKSRLPDAAADELVVVLLRNVPAQLLQGVLSHPFIRRSFLTSDVDALCWPGLGPGKPAASGTVVLVGRGSEGLLPAVFRVRTAFGEQGEGGEDVCFVDVRMQGGVVGRIGILAGREGAEGAGEWIKAEGVKWGVLAAPEELEIVRGLGSRHGGVFWHGECEQLPGGNATGGLLNTQFRIIG